jgi:P63C domain
MDIKAEAAKALSDLGASKGGLARAQSLTPEQRSQSARMAVEARWAKVGIKPVPSASHTGELKFGDIIIPCAVLEDGMRVLSERGISRGLGSKRGGSHWKRKKKAAEEGGAELPVYLSANNLKRFISNELTLALSSPILYRVPGTGSIANGMDATNLPKVCEVFLAARDAKVLTKAQEKFAVAADLLLRGLAHTGIVALVDEATGYQDERARDALARILEAFIAKELRPWVRTFPTDFYKEMFRLRQIPYRTDVKRPQYIGVLTNDLVYSRLAPGVLEELRRVTPRDDKGRLKHHLHRRLTDDVGHPKLQQHLSAVTALMKASDTWKQFKPMVDRALPKYKRLPLFDGLEAKELKA